MPGEAGFETPLTNAIEDMYKLGLKSASGELQIVSFPADFVRSLCMVAWQAEYYRTKAPNLTGVNLKAALDDLSETLEVAQ